MDWEKTKCTKCESNKWCRTRSVSKGSQACQVKLKLREPYIPQANPSTSMISQASALIYQLMGMRRKQPKEEPKEKKKEEETITAYNNLNKEEPIIDKKEV